jgi:hypothetical protein
MVQSDVRTLTLGDVMLLVAMTGLGLSCYVFVDNAMMNGQRYIFYGLFEWPVGRWDSPTLIDHLMALIASLLTLTGGWTVAFPVLRLRQPRPRWRIIARQPGVTASVAAMTGIAFYAVAAGSTCLMRWWIDGLSRFPRNFEDIVTYAGVSTAAVWSAQIASCRWRPSADWVDRLGRFLGGLWIAAAFVFSLRHALA